MMKFPIYGKIKKMFQTTNQFKFGLQCPSPYDLIISSLQNPFDGVKNELILSKNGIP